MKHTKTDPVCIYFKETWPFLRYLNERARGKACLICVPNWKPAPALTFHRGQSVRVISDPMRDGRNAGRIGTIASNTIDGVYMVFLGTHYSNFHKDDLEEA